VAKVVPAADWRAIVVLPPTRCPPAGRGPCCRPVTRSAMWSANIQRFRCLDSPLRQGRADLLRIAMSDRIHQPVSSANLQAAAADVAPGWGARNSGRGAERAGPAVLVVVEGEEALGRASAAIWDALGGPGGAELLVCRFVPSGANQTNV